MEKQKEMSEENTIITRAKNFKDEVKKAVEMEKEIEAIREKLSKHELQIRQAEVNLMKVLFEKNKEDDFLKVGKNVIFISDTMFGLTVNSQKQLTKITVIDANAIVL